MPTFMLSTCSTSLLTNDAPPALRSLVVRYANARSAEAIDAESLRPSWRTSTNESSSALLTDSGPAADRQT